MSHHTRPPDRRHRPVAALLVAVALAGGACLELEGPSLDKDEVAGGKADASDPCLEIGAEPGCDVCLEMGWYGDGVCDRDLIDLGACRGPDEDCEELGCFETHLVDAIALNEERADRYAALTGGESRSVSGPLIASEKVSRFLARSFDQRAIFWRQRGIPIMCDEFVSMELVPEFRAQASTPPAPLDSYDEHNAFLLGAKLAGALAFGGFEGLGRRLEDEIAALDATPEYHCMERHILESLLRAANLAPRHRRDADRLGLDSPETLSRDLILSHIATLGLATWLDNRAAPIQARGVPILCRDLPPIAPWPQPR